MKGVSQKGMLIDVDNLTLIVLVERICWKVLGRNNNITTARKPHRLGSYYSNRYYSVVLFKARNVLCDGWYIFADDEVFV